MDSVATLFILFLFLFRLFPTQAWIRSRVPSFITICQSHVPFVRTTQLPAQQRHLLPSLSNSKTEVAVVSRTVPITNDWSVTVWEWETPAPLVEDYWSAHEEDLQHQQHRHNHHRKQQSPTASKTTLLDPFGLITWPGALVAAHELLEQPHLLQNNTTVLVLGSGVGLEVQVAAQLGAARVYALDVHPTTLQLLQYGIPSHLSHVVTPIIFDLCHPQMPLPHLETVDLMIVADVLYNPELAQHVARRCREAYDQGIRVLVTDSQRLVHNFVEMIPPCTSSNNTRDSSPSSLFAWQERRLNDFTGSGILVKEDQTYNVSARILWMKFLDNTQDRT